MTSIKINPIFSSFHLYYGVSPLEYFPISPHHPSKNRTHLLNSTYRLFISVAALACVPGDFIAHADSSDQPPTLRPNISDNANLFSPKQTAQLQQLIERARKDGNIAATVVAETTMLRLTPLQRANELNNEYRDQWPLAFPNQPLAEEIDLASSDGPTRSAEMQPLPLTFYFVRASGQGSQLFAVGGLSVLKSEIGIPESNAIYYEAGTHYGNVLKTSEDPSRAFMEMIDLFLNAAATRRSGIYRDDKPGNSSVFTAILLIGSGILFIVALVFALRKLSGQGRQDITEATLPKLPLKTRLGGSHSGGMSAQISWAEPSKTSQTDDTSK